MSGIKGILDGSTKGNMPIWNRLKYTGRIDPKISGFAVVGLINLVAAIILGELIIDRKHYPLDGDEAIHALRGLVLTLDLKKADIGAFLSHSYAQSIYPPGNSWFESIAFLLFGLSAVTARLYSLIFLLGSTFVVYAIGLEIEKKWGWLIGLIAVFLTVGSQFILIYSALIMLELPGLFISLLTLLIYIKAARSNRFPLYIVTSLFMALTAMFKYQYGIIIVGTIGLSEVVRIAMDRPEIGKELIQRLLFLFLPFLLFMIVWFMGEQNVDGFLYYLGAQPKQVNFYEIENLVFYARSFMYHYAPSTLIAVLSIASLFWGFFNSQNETIRIVLNYCLIGFILFTAKESNNPRFFLTVVPGAYLLFAGMVVWFSISWISKRTEKIQPAIVLSLILLGISIASIPNAFNRLKVVPRLLTSQLETDPRANDMVEWIINQTDNGRIYLVNPWDQFTSHNMEWYRISHYPEDDKSLDDLAIPYINLKDISKERIADIEEQLKVFESDYLVVLEGGPDGTQSWQDFDLAIGNQLEPNATKDFKLSHYTLNNWIKKTEVTTKKLNDAAKKYNEELFITVRIYKVVN